MCIGENFQNKTKMQHKAVTEFAAMLIQQHHKTANESKYILIISIILSQASDRQPIKNENVSQLSTFKH